MQPIVATTEHNRQNAMAALDRYLEQVRARSEAGVNRIMTEVPQDKIVRGGALGFSAMPSGLVGFSAPFGAAIHDNALAQFADKAEIGMGYIRHLQEQARVVEAAEAERRARASRAHHVFSQGAPQFERAPNWAAELLAKTMTEHAAHVLGNSRYLVRGQPMEVRAILSDKFRRVDCRPGLDSLLGEANKVGARCLTPLFLTFACRFASSFQRCKRSRLASS